MAEVLSQSQIDALLNAARNGEMDLAAKAESSSEKKYRKYDFYSPRKFTKDRLKMLSGVFENYTRIINSRINGLLHTTCEIEVESVEEQRYYEFSNALLELDFSADEDVVCITENDACGVDAIQVLLGCSVGKGNLLFHLRGKQAFSFYNRKTGKAVRLVLRPTPAEYQTKEERFRYLQDAAPASLFDVKPAVLSLPEKARLFQSLPCDGCGEVTAEHLLRLENGKKLCLDCFRAYNRFDV